MKKQIIISSIIAATLWSSAAVAMINTTNTGTKDQSNQQLAIATTSLNTPSPIISSNKNETVFVTTDEAGNPKSKFIGSTLYNGNEALPFNFKITYFLDGTEISAKDLAGKSGHIKIVFSYNSTTSYQNKLIPFLATTGLTLDHAKFTNLQITNGKIVKEDTTSYIIVGYSLVGINTDLGTDFLPETFTLEADTTDFRLKDTYTIFMNDILADLDTSKLNSIDSLINSVYDLSDGFDKIISGTNTLSDGLNTAYTGAQALYAGSQALAEGTTKIATGANQLASGLDILVSNNSAIQSGASKVANTIISKANDALQLLKSLGASIPFDEITSSNYQEVYQTFTANVDTYKTYISIFLDTLPITTEQKAVIMNLFDQALEAISGLKSLVDLNLGIISYTNGVATAANGASELANALSILETNTYKLSAGIGSLMEGQAKLYEGSVTLKNGLSTFKSAGIDKLVNFAEKDLAGFIRNFRNTVSAANSYRSFGSTDAKSVKFIVKTPSI